MNTEPTLIDDRSLEADEIQVLLSDDDETWARTQRRLLERHSDRLSVETAHSLTETRQRLASATPDCLVCDYQLGDGTALELLSEIRDSHPELPFILVTGQGDEAVASEAIGNDVTGYIRKSTLGSQSTLLGRRIESVVDSVRTERALAHERRSKEALLEVITTSDTRETLATDICRHLVDERQCACAWIGVLDSTGVILPLASAGATEYVTQVLEDETRTSSRSEPALVSLEENASVVIPSFEEMAGPGVADVAESETEFEWGTDETSTSDGGQDHWEHLAAKHGFRSIGAVPIEHDGIRFGVLAVYAPSSGQIDEREIAFITEYADTVGYALQATNWRETLLSSTATHVEFTIDDSKIPLVALSRALPDTATLEVPTVIPRNETEVLCVVTISSVAKQSLLDATTTIDSVRSIDVYETGDPLRCGVVIEGPIPELIVVERGGQFERTSVTDSQASVSAHFGEHTSANQIETGLRDRYENVSATMIQSDHPQESTESSEDYPPLTDRQREVLELALQMGYFERPRGKNAQELASLLDISRATFTQHVRAAEQKIMSGVIGGENQ